MIAVFRHEVASFFSSVTGYVLGGFLLLFAGIYTMAYNLKGSYVNFEYVLGGMAFAFLIIVPILTMRILAEEKRQKTDQLLYSLPLSMTQVVLGKYLALLVVFLIPLAIMSIYPLVLTLFGNVYLPAAFGAIGGFLFLGAALAAVGMFISSITESQAVAAGVCFVVVLVNYYLSDLSNYLSTSALASMIAIMVVVVVLVIIMRLMTRNTLMSLLTGLILELVLVGLYSFGGSQFEGLIPDILQQLSLFERFYNFVDGVFDITGIVYFLTVIGIFLFLSVQSMEKRRWSE